MSHDHHQHHTAVDAAGFWDLWSPVYPVLLLVVAFFYFRAIKGKNVPVYQKGLFLSGLVLFYIVLGSPVNYYGHHYLFSAHMLQQSVLYYVVPPLLILGTPKFIFESMVQKAWMKKLLETHLVFALLAFDILFSIYHLPLVFDYIMGHYQVMVTVHLFLFLLAVQMWWPIISPLPEFDQISELKKIGFILLGAVLITPACGLIIFASDIAYEAYKGAPQVIAFLTPMDDQQLGGIVMKLVQELSFGSVIAYIFFRWYRRENTTDLNPVRPELAIAQQSGKNQD